MTEAEKQPEEVGRVSIELPIQIHSRPSTPGALSYNMEVLAKGRTEADFEEQLLSTAFELGLTIPEEPKDEVKATENVMALTIASESPEPVSSAPSRASESTRPTSFSSSERNLEHRLSPAMASSVTMSSNGTPPSSILSSNLRENPYSKIRKSIRRLSTFTKRRTLNNTVSLMPPPSPVIRSLPSETRPSTAEPSKMPKIPKMPHTPIQLVSAPHSPRLSRPCTPPRSPQSPAESERRRAVGTLLPSLSTSRVSTLSKYLPQRPLTPPSEGLETDETRAARERSLRCGHLQRMRIQQLDEQSRFLMDRHSQMESIRLKYADEWSKARTALEEQKAAAAARRATALSDLENRHLAAEMELERALEQERHACETKLKHMEAYCHGRRGAAPAPETLIRRVTEQDYRKLVEQYHVRNGLTNLHASRINVLREKQARQVERIVARQEAEMERIEEEANGRLEARDVELRAEEEESRKAFAERKKKLLWRWKVVEAIERRRLELELGVEYGELPGIQWSEEERLFDVA